NQDDLRISYRLVDVGGELGVGSDDPDLAAKNLNLLAKRLAFGQKLPVAIIRGGERPLLAVAADRPIVRCDYQLTPHVATLFQRRTGKTIRDQTFSPEGARIAANVFDWTVQKAGVAPAGRRLDPDSAAIQYGNIGNDEERYGALSLCKMMLNADDPRVASSRR